jgi:alpha-L-fucosidase
MKLNCSSKICRLSATVYRHLYGLFAFVIVGVISAFGVENQPASSNPSRSAVERFQDAKVGLSIHWGPSSLGGYEISWSRGKEIPVERYDQFYRSFNPVKFDADVWCRFMKDAGFRYVVPTAKHHDGFGLWFSKVSDYDMENTPFHRDLMRELSAACRRHGIHFGVYYSILDWYHPDWPENKHGGPGPLFARKPDAPNLARYLDYMRAQCGELIRDYGAELIQFDGGWDACWTHELGSQLYRDLRTLSPKVLLSSRVGNPKVCPGDYEERERHVGQGATNSVLGFAGHPWQAWVTIDKTQWAYNPRPEKQLLTSEDIIRDLIATICDNGNYLINLGPRPDGTFDPREAAIVLEAGKWIRAHAEAIYGTRGGPFPRADWGGSTHKGKRVFLFVSNPGPSELNLRMPGTRIKRARALGGRVIPFKMDGDLLHLDLSAAPRNLIATVIQLDLDRPVAALNDSPR